MQVLRERHHVSREALKELLVQLIDEHGFSHIISWNDFAFTGKTKGTIVRGEIFERELHLEVTGLLEKLAIKKIRHTWKTLVLQGIV